jgi:hypothetical protein
MRLALYCSGVCLLSSAILANVGPKSKAERVWTETVSFAPGGTVRILDSFGEIKVEGWDRPEVEVTVRKATQRAYAPEDLPAALERLDRIQIRLSKDAPDQLTLSSVFPSHAKSKLDLSYTVRVPKESDLQIRHEVGDVEIVQVGGNIEATNRIGEIHLNVPEGVSYALDARAKIGDISSDVEGISRREHLVGQSLVSDTPKPLRQLYLRVGIGDINVRRLSACGKCRTDI